MGDSLAGDMDTTGAGRAVERGMAVYVTGTTECTCSLTCHSDSDSLCCSLITG